MKRVLMAFAVVFIAAAISVFVTGPDGSAEAQPITGGNPSGIARVHHGSAFYGLGTSGTPLDLRHDCSTGSGQTWDGSAWQCAAVGGGFTNAGSGLTSSGSTVNVNATTGGMIAVLADSIGLDGAGCGTGWVPTWGSGSAWACAAPAGGGGSGSGTVTSITCGAGLTCTSTNPITGAGTISVTGGGVSGSLSVTVNTFPAGPVNLSTVGTTDWYWYGNTANPAVGGGGGGADWSASTSTALHWKKGGELFRNFVWIGHGIGSAPGTFPGTTTFTSTASDDTYGVALSATDGTYDLTSTVGLGYQLNAAAGPTARTLRLYTGAKGVVTTITASFDDGSVTAASSTFSAASGVHELRAVDVAFQAAAGTRLRVTVLATTLNGGIEDEDFYGVAEF